MIMLKIEVLLHYFVFIHRILLTETSIRILDKGILPLEKNSVAIQFYFDIENRDKLNACRLSSRPEICCLSDNEDMDCDIIKVYGDYNDVLKPKYRDTVLYIYPTVTHHDLVGYCSFFLEHRCSKRKNKRETVKIPFDTRLKNKSQYLFKGYVNGQKIAPCETLDQDSLNQCRPVNCDVKYSGYRPFYDTESSKCIEAVECLSDPKLNLPDIVYVPKNNICRDLNNPLTVADIYAISTGLGIIAGSTVNEDIKMTLESNCSTISQNLMFLRDMLYGKLFPMKLKVDFSESCNVAMVSILRCIIGLSLILILFVLVVNTTAWVHKKWRNGELKKKIQDFKAKIRTSKLKDCKKKVSRINDDVKNKLLREVIVSDLPLELRDSVFDICDRIGKEVKWKKRYRMEDIGSQVNFKEIDTSVASTASDYQEQQKLLK